MKSERTESEKDTDEESNQEENKSDVEFAENSSQETAEE